MPPARKPPEPPPTPTLDERAEKAWKWMLRGLGAIAFMFTLVMALAFHAQVPLGAWVIIGGLIGLPNALPLSQVVDAWKSSK